MLLCMMVGLAACSDDEDDKVDNGYTTYNVSVQLLYPEDSEVQSANADIQNFTILPGIVTDSSNVQPANA